MGNETEFLVDTGSTYSIMDSLFYDSLNDKPSLEKINLILKNANGEVMNVCGQTNLDFEVQGHKFRMPVKVVSLSDKSTILGLDFMKDQQCIFNVAKGTMKFNDKLITLHMKGSTRCGRIQAQRNFCVPPQHEMIIRGHVKSDHWVSGWTTGLVEPLVSVTEKTGLAVAKSLVKVGNSAKPRVANFGLDPIKINKNSVVAMLEPLTQVKHFDNDKSLFQNTETGTLNMIEEQNIPELPEFFKPLVENTSGDLKETELFELTKQLYQYQDIFKSPDGQLGRTNMLQNRVDTGNAVPIKQCPRRLPVSQ